MPPKSLQIIGNPAPSMQMVIGNEQHSNIFPVSIPKTRFSEPLFSEILDLMNNLQLPFSYFTLYPDTIL